MNNANTRKSNGKGLSLSNADTSSLRAGVTETVAATSPEGNGYTYEREDYSLLEKAYLMVFTDFFSS